MDIPVPIPIQFMTAIRNIMTGEGGPEDWKVCDTFQLLGAPIENWARTLVSYNNPGADLGEVMEWFTQVLNQPEIEN